jgi:hypothetical protein
VIKPAEFFSSYNSLKILPIVINRQAGKKSLNPVTPSIDTPSSSSESVVEKGLVYLLIT